MALLQKRIISRCNQLSNPQCLILPALSLLLLAPQAMALLQKRIISRCNQLGKPVLMTRFVDTMVSTPRPTRAGERFRGGWLA